MEILVCTKKSSDNFLKQKNCKIFNSIDNCIKENPDFAIISNETSFHIKTALILAKAGIHLLIEKPLSHSITRTNQLLDIIKKKKLVVLIGCNFRFHPSLELIRKSILKGDLGRIISAKVENGSFLPEWHPNENFQKNYASREDLGGGVVLTCIHEIDYLYWFFGNIHDVFSITGRFSDLNIKAEDLSSIILRFKNNVIAETHLDYFQQPSARNCKIIGTKGTMTWDIESNTVRYYNIKTKKWIIKSKLQNYDMNNTYIKELMHFINCIKGQEKPINDLKQGIYVLKIALAIKKSSKLKKTLTVDR